MFNTIYKYYNIRNFTNLNIIQHKNECNKKNYLLVFGGTIYCLENNSNTIDNWEIKHNDIGLTPNIPVNSNDSIGINIYRTKKKDINSK